MKKILSALLCMLVMLTACTNSTEPVETNNTLLSLEDDTYYLELGSDLDLTKALKLEDGETLELDGDYDLTKAGTYNIKFVVTDKDGNKTESDKTIVVDEKDKLEELKKEQVSSKPADPSISKDQPTETEKPADGTVVETPIESQKPSESEDKEIVDTNTSSGSSSNTGGLDTSNWMIQAAYDLEGTSGGCEYVASLYLNNIGMPPEAGELQEISSPFTGALVKYYDDNWNYKHTAVYLANNMCLHGNYSSDGTAKVASCDLYSHRVYYDPQSVVDTIDNSSSSSESSSNDSIWAEYYENDADGYTADMCAVPAIELSNNSSLAFWCEDYYPDLIIWE